MSDTNYRWPRFIALVDQERGQGQGKRDMRIEQQLPGMTEGGKFAAFLVIDNLTNPLDDDRGKQRQVNLHGYGARGAGPASRRGDTSGSELPAHCRHAWERLRRVPAAAGGGGCGRDCAVNGYRLHLPVTGQSRRWGCLITGPIAR